MAATAQETPLYLPLLRDMPQSELPRERLRARGPQALSEVELLAILLRTGSRGEHVIDLAKRLLRETNGLEGLGRMSPGELAAKRSVGPAKAAQVAAAIELGRRIGALSADGRTVITHPAHVYALVGAEMALLEQEHLRVILMNTRHQVMGVREVYKGNVHTAVVRVSEVFRDAVRENTPSIIIVHNHPSGDPSPSPADASLTAQVRAAGELLGIDVVDHVVIGRRGAYSMRDNGLGFPRDGA